MTVSSATTPTTSASTAGALGGPDLGRDEFLQLLVAQLRNQDPTNPQDGHEFAAQLAQFSTVEQLTSINESVQGQARLLSGLTSGVQGLQAGQSAMAGRLSSRIDLGSATALIGQTVEMSGARVEWSGGAPVDIPVRVGAEVREVTAVVRDASGAVVRTLRAGGHAAGGLTIEWDGSLDDGSAAPNGTYSVSVSAVGADGAAAPATAVTRGTVDRLTIEGDGVFLWVDGRPIPFADLLSVLPGAPPASPASGLTRPDSAGTFDLSP
ncbi:flagellar hook assembly protein FlgD [Rubrivirga sp. IMCC43871]|uniref:flagellar hook assembly protein FlgD n=1 Tax=Rubrivirga sp. IMCC43871 TaxID=3391575 RepID=UPI003990221F